MSTIEDLYLQQIRKGVPREKAIRIVNPNPSSHLRTRKKSRESCSLRCEQPALPSLPESTKMPGSRYRSTIDGDDLLGDLLSSRHNRDLTYAESPPASLRDDPRRRSKLTPEDRRDQVSEIYKHREKVESEPASQPASEPEKPEEAPPSPPVPIRASPLTESSPVQFTKPPAWFKGTPTKSPPKPVSALPLHHPVSLRLYLGPYLGPCVCVSLCTSLACHLTLCASLNLYASHPARLRVCDSARVPESCQACHALVPRGCSRGHFPISRESRCRRAEQQRLRPVSQGHVRRSGGCNGRSSAAEPFHPSCRLPVPRPSHCVGSSCGASQLTVSQQ